MVSSGLYLVMRYFGYFDAELYRLDECEKDDNGALLDMEIPELYKIRKYDLCEATVSVLARYAGISRPSVYEGLQDLKARHLVEGPWMDEDGTQRWKVYIRPPQYFKRGFLNDEIGKAHMRERERLDGKCKKASGMCKKASGRRVKKLPVCVKKTVLKQGGQC
jgi:hypothetical protein